MRLCEERDWRGGKGRRGEGGMEGGREEGGEGPFKACLGFYPAKKKKTHPKRIPTDEVMRILGSERLS